MSCSLENFNNEFDNISYDSDTVDITNHPKREEMIHWANTVNFQAEIRGFEDPLFRVDSMMDGKVILNINEDSHVKFDDYMKNVVRQDMMYEEVTQKEFAKDLDDIIGEVSQDQKDGLYDLTRFDGEAALYANYSIPDDDFNPEAYDPDSTYTANYNEWRETREALRDQVHSLLKKENRKNSNPELRSKLFKMLESIQQEIQDFPATAEGVFQGIEDEINSLEGIIDQIMFDPDPENPEESEHVLPPGESAKIFESSFVDKRIGTLAKLFLDFDAKDSKRKYDFIYEGMPENEALQLKEKTERLIRKYQNAKNRIVFNAVVDNEYVVQLGKMMKTPSEKKQMEELVEAVREFMDRETQDADGSTLYGTDGDNWSGFILAASTYDSVLVKILSLERNKNESIEAGITGLNESKFSRAYDELAKQVKKVKDKDGKTRKEYFIDKMWQVDEFGTRTQRLVDYQSKEFGDFIGNVFELSKAYRQFAPGDASSQGAYENWMESLKENANFIDVRKIASVAEMFKAEEKYKGEFSFSDTEMSLYEKEMREIYGDTVFEIELEKSIQELQNFAVSEYSDATVREAKNPLRFLKNFYSENYNSPNDITHMHYLPSYLRFLPKDGNMLNQQFRDLQEEAEDKKAFHNFYSSFIELNKYQRDSEQTFGKGSQRNEVLALKDTLNREVMQDLNFFGKISAQLRKIWEALWSVYDQGSIENLENDPDYHRSSHSKFKDHFHKHSKFERLNSAEIFYRKSDQDLLELATEHGLTIPSSYYKTISEGKPLSHRDKKRLSQSISSKIYSRTTSMDIKKSVLTGVQLARNANARYNTLSLLEFVFNFAVENKLENTVKVISNYKAADILQLGNLQLDNGLSKLVRKKVSKRKLNPEEKVFLKLLEDEKHNYEEGHFDFFIPSDDNPLSDGKIGVRYTRVYNETTKEYEYRATSNDPKDADIATQVISFEEIGAKYEEYLDNKMNSLGSHRVLGKVMQGLVWNMSKSFLGFKPSSGYKNLWEGQNQIKEQAATGLYGFNYDDYIRAQNLFNGFTSVQLIELLTGKIETIDPNKKNLTRKDKAQLKLQNAFNLDQINSLRYLAEKMGLLQKQSVDMSGSDGSSVLQKAGEKTKMFTMAPAIDIPEFFNQMVTLVALMQNPKFAIKDKDGNETLLYDPKTKSFPFDPITMQLLPQFRENADGSPNDLNIKNWEQFRADSQGNNPQMVLKEMFMQTRNEGQGNYSEIETPIVSSTLTGKSLTALMRWSFEGVNREYGGKKIDLVFGRLNMQGRLMTISKSPHLASSFILLDALMVLPEATAEVWHALPKLLTFKFRPMWKSLVNLAASVVNVPVSTAFMLAGVKKIATERYKEAKLENKKALQTISHILYKKGQKGDQNWAKQTLNFWKEVGLRSAKTVVGTHTKNKVNLISEGKIKQWTKTDEVNWQSKTLTHQERQVISALAQRVANSFNTTIHFLIAGTAANIVTAVLMKGLKGALFGDDDEERNLSEETIYKILSRYEGVIRWLENRKNAHLAENNQYMSTKSLKETFSALVFVEYLEGMDKDLDSAYMKYQKGHMSPKEMWYTAGKTAIQGVFGVPSIVFDMAEDAVLGTGKEPFQHDNVRGDRSVASRPLEDWFKTPEEKAKYTVDIKRKDIREQLRWRRTEKLRKAAKEEGKFLTKEEEKDIVNASIRQSLEEVGVYKTNNNTYEEIANKDWDEILKTLIDQEIKGTSVEAHKTPKTPKKPKTSTSRSSSRSGSSRSSGRSGSSRSSGRSGG